MIIFDKKNNYYTPTGVDVKKFIIGFGTKKDIDLSLFCPEAIISLQQVHKATVKLIGEKSVIKKNMIISKCDGVITDQKKILLTVKTADCLPIAVVDSKRDIVAAVHAGRKGSLDKIVLKTLEKFRMLQSRTKDIQFFFGPSIGICCYQVGKDIYNIFSKMDKTNFADCSRREKNKYYISLARINYFQLIRAGVLPSSIQTTPLCTKCRSDRFYSFRRGNKNKRMLNFAMMI